MQKIVFLFITGVLLSYSCSSDDDGDPTTYENLWVLVKMSGATPNSETTGDAMQWQEFYNFAQNRTFTKSRTREGKITKLSGKFRDSVIQGEPVLLLSYPEENEIIGSCSGTPEELLYVKSTNLMISNWQACDGPALFYEKM